MFERFRRSRTTTDPASTSAYGGTALSARTADVYPVRARGGVTGGAVLTGVVVAIGGLLILSAIITVILVALGYLSTNPTTHDIQNAGIGAGIGLVVAQFLSYLWGGYAA